MLKALALCLHQKPLSLCIGTISLGLYHWALSRIPFQPPGLSHKFRDTLSTSSAAIILANCVRQTNKWRTWENQQTTWKACSKYWERTSEWGGGRVCVRAPDSSAYSLSNSLESTPSACTHTRFICCCCCSQNRVYHSRWHSSKVINQY